MCKCFLRRTFPRIEHTRRFYLFNFTSYCHCVSLITAERSISHSSSHCLFRQAFSVGELMKMTPEDAFEFCESETERNKTKRRKTSHNGAQSQCKRSLFMFILENGAEGRGTARRPSAALRLLGAWLLFSRTTIAFSAHCFAITLFSFTFSSFALAGSYFLIDGAEIHSAECAANFFQRCRK